MLTAERPRTRLATLPVEDLPCPDSPRPAAGAFHDFGPGRVVVSGTVWQGREGSRAAFDNWATGPADVAILKQAVADIGHRLLAGGWG